MKKLMSAFGIVCLVLTTSMFTQTINATLGGTVSDVSGALIPGVTITATNTQTGIVSMVLSNESGAYQFASLQPGTYKVSSDLAGFQTQVYNDVALGLSQQVRLNFTLQVSSVAQSLEVTVAADTLLATSSSSVGSVLPEYKVRDLPLTNRNVLDLVNTAAGAQGSNFAGGRVGMANITRDGLSVQEGRYQNGVYSVTYVSPDLVEEVRVIVAPVDAETGRGSGQVQMATRSGTNQFRGSWFWTNRNSALDANSWFNNFNRVDKNFLNRNQFGGRLGGPIAKNKTFFFFLYEGMRTVQKEIVTANVLTEPARQGIFRYFPGVQNANAFSSNPTVDLSGNPVRPQGATGALQSFSLFGRDPLRPGFDPTGQVQRIIAGLPPANSFTTGDGLNTAGYQWVRRTLGSESFTGTGENINRNQYNLRIDHNFNSSHKLSLVGTRESDWSDSNLYQTPNGKSPGDSDRGGVYRNPLVYTGSFVSTLSPTVLNEFRFGLKASRLEQPAAWDDPRPGGRDKFASFPRVNGIPYIVVTTFFQDSGNEAASRGAVSPHWAYSDTLSWTQGKHAFKGGGEFRIGGTDGFNSDRSLPRVNLGPSTSSRRYGVPGSGIPVTGIDNTTVPGLAAADQTNARMLLSDLAGSVAEIVERFTLCCDSKNIKFQDYSEQWRKYRKFRQSEVSAFFKDDWKIRPDLTLNLGLRYEYYAVPYETQGYTTSPIGGGSALLRGDFIRTEFVGKKSQQPDKQLYQDDWNNFAPSVGLSWSIPYFGKDKTILRAGYGWSYQGLAAGGGGRQLDEWLGETAGSNQAAVDQSFTYRDLRNVVLPLPQRYPPGQFPVTPLTARSEQLWAFDTDMKTPYIQNWNLELQRELAQSLTLEARYVGSKGTRLFGGIPLNNVRIFENGILEAFNITRAGGNAPLFDRMLRGLDLGLGPVNGTTVTGSASLRQNTNSRGLIANSNVGQFASYLNTTANFAGEPGGLLRNGGLPENFIVLSPQFGTADYISTPGSSTYHSMQLQMTKRLSGGITNQTSYTWSRALGNDDGDGVKQYRDPDNRALDKTLLGFHRTHSFRSNGTFELPFGPNRAFLKSTPGWVSRLVEQWQFGAILSLNSGAPLTINAPVSTLTETTIGTPDIVGEFPKSIGKVTYVSNGVVYFDGLGQVTDPGRTTVTTLQSTQGSFSNRAITDSQGQLLLVNPAPGKLGTLGQRWIEGPANLGLDMNLIKRIRIAETKQFELRMDAINVLNHANFGNPNLNINSTSFGRITSATGARTFTLNARLNF